MRILSALSGFLATLLTAQAPAPMPPEAGGFALSGTATLGSQYIWRGLTQTDGRPTVQGGLDLAHPSGVYLGVALSNISWFTDQNAGLASDPTALGSPGRVGAPLYTPNGVNSASVELDLAGGCKWSLGKDWTLDAGLFRYLYPGSYGNVGAFRAPHTTEAYLGIANAWASLKLSRGLSGSYMGVAHALGTTYLDLSLAVPLGESGWTVLLHGGRTTYPANANRDFFFNGTRVTGDNAMFSYSDFRLGVAKAFKGLTVTLALTEANSRSRASDQDVPVYENAMGRNVGGSRVALTLGKAF